MPVMPKRTYDSAWRQAQARRTRGALLDAARHRFLTEGFAATTVAVIASDVGVSVDTIYKAFGGKPGLVRAICAHALAGEGPVPAETRSDALHGSETDPRAIIRGWGALTSEVAPRIVPLLLLIRDAAIADPEMAELQADMDRQRLERMTDNARRLANAGHLRRGLTVEHAGEIMWTYSSPQLYELLVLIRRWPLLDFTAFITDAMIAALLPPQQKPRQSRAH
jgi:AcrR family transcriptional regulator